MPISQAKASRGRIRFHSVPPNPVPNQAHSDFWRWDYPDFPSGERAYSIFHSVSIHHFERFVDHRRAPWLPVERSFSGKASQACAIVRVPGLFRAAGIMWRAILRHVPTGGLKSADYARFLHLVSVGDHITTSGNRCPSCAVLVGVGIELSGKRPRTTTVWNTFSQEVLPQKQI